MLLLGSLIESCKNWSAYCSGPMVVSNLMKQIKEKKIYQAYLQ